MEKENKVIAQIIQRFPVLEERINIKQPLCLVMRPLVRRDFEKVFYFVTHDMDFDFLHVIIGVDEGSDIMIIYTLSNHDKVTLMLKEKVSKGNPLIKSVCDQFPSAYWYERELMDMLGLVLEGIPEGPRYPLPDNWPAGNHPLRKVWDPECFDLQQMAYKAENQPLM